MSQHIVSSCHSSKEKNGGDEYDKGGGDEDDGEYTTGFSSNQGGGSKRCGRIRHKIPEL